MESFDNDNDNETKVSENESTKETEIHNSNRNNNINKRKSISTTKSNTKKKQIKSAAKKHKPKSTSKDKSSKNKATNRKQKRPTKPKQLLNTLSQPITFKKEPSTSKTIHLYNKTLLTNLFSKYDEPKDIILNYMLIQTRPYNTTIIFDELHGQITKKQIQHTLDSLTTESKLISKEYNNTKLYMINHSIIEQASQDQIDTVDNNIKYYKDKLNTLALQYQQKQNELQQITHEYTDEQIDALIMQMKERKKTLINKVTQIQMQKNNVDNVIIHEDKMEHYEKIYNNMLLKYKTIRKVCLNIIDQIAEEMEMKSNKVKDIIGIINEKPLIEKYNINIY